jgi:hypothetical protein
MCGHPNVEHRGRSGSLTCLHLAGVGRRYRSPPKIALCHQVMAHVRKFPDDDGPIKNRVNRQVLLTPDQPRRQIVDATQSGRPQGKPVDHCLQGFGLPALQHPHALVHVLSDSRYCNVYSR